LQEQVKAIIPISETIFAEDKKFALLSQNYPRFALDELKSRIRLGNEGAGVVPVLPPIFGNLLG